MKYLKIRAGLVLLILAGVAFAGGEPPSGKKWQGKKLYLRQTPNVNPQVHVHVDQKRIYYTHAESRLFPVDKPEEVIIKELRRQSDHLEVVFENRYLGIGKIRVYGASSSRLLDAAMESAFAESAEEAEPEFILNTRSGFVHFTGSNHLPPGEFRQPVGKDELNSNHHVKCPVCFREVPQIAGYSLELEMREAMMREILSRYPLSTDEQARALVQKVGKTVLSRWVTALKGYQYKFYVVDSDRPASFSAPAGAVYVTTGLLNALESPTELEAVLAAEIAHIELRHGFRQYRGVFERSGLKNAVSWLSNATWFVAPFASPAILGRQMDRFDQLTKLATTVIAGGLSQEFQAEADAMTSLYFDANETEEGKEAYINVLRKLHYHDGLYDWRSEGSSSGTPASSLEARLDSLQNARVEACKAEDQFFGYDKNDDLVAKVAFQMQRSYRGTLNSAEVGLQLLALIRATSALREDTKIDEIKISSGGRIVELDNREKTRIFPNDAVGVSFVSKDHRHLLASIDSIDLDLPNVVRWAK